MLSETKHDTEDQPDHHNGRLWRAMQAMRLQPQGESIHCLLDENTKKRITVKDMWIEVCMIKSIELVLSTMSCNFHGCHV